MDRLTFLIVALLGVTPALGGCTNDGAAQPAAERPGERERPAPGVRVAEAVVGSIEEVVPFTGQVEALDRVMLAPDVSGRIEALSVDVGDVVEAGQELARIDDDVVARQLQLERARLDVASAREAQALAALEIAQREQERMETLVTSGVRTDTELIAIRDDVARLQAAYDVATTEVTLQARARDLAAAELDRYRVIAPFDGLVVERMASQGSMVSAQSAVIALLDPASLRLRVDVPEQTLPGLSAGQTARVRFDAIGDESFEARVVRIEPEIETASRTGTIELEVPEAADRLRVGMFARGAFIARRVDDAVLVPLAAVHDIPDSPDRRVWVVSDEDTVAPVTVEERLRDETRAALRGLEPGTRVVVTPVDRLEEGGDVVVVGS